MQVFTATQLNTHLQFNWKALAQDKKTRSLDAQKEISKEIKIQRKK